MKVETKQDNLAAVLRSIAELVKTDVLVGIPADADQRDDGSPLNNAQLAYLHTYGGTIAVPEHETTLYRQVGQDGEFANGGRFVKRKRANFASTHIVPAHIVTLPPRPFLEPGIKKGQQEIVAQQRKAAEAAINRKPDEMLKAINAAGLVAQNHVRDIFDTSEGLEPLKPSTLASRRARGRTGERPLVDKGELRNANTYVVRKKA